MYIMPPNSRHCASACYTASLSSPMSSKPDKAPGYATVVQILALSVALKALLFPFYHSTDFEVHRNWLAITHSLPLHKWYHESTSEWTLDYPPFFAYFEFVLSLAAQWFDADMLKIQNLNHDSFMTVVFQRSSVLVSETVLHVAVLRYLASSSMLQPRRSRRDGLVIFLLVVFHAGLIIVDNIHFQYNGMMLGLIILCADFANRRQHRRLAATFSLLVLTKHLFAPLAPVVGAYLLKAHCVQCTHCDGSTPTAGCRLRLLPGRFLELCLIALAALTAAFLPFLLITAPAAAPASSLLRSVKSMELLTFETGGAQMQVLLPLVPLKCILDWEYSVAQLQQIASRLFPFGRGLVHAYWAPNLWALYIMLDKGLKRLAALFAARSMQTQSPLLAAAAFILCPGFDSSERAGHSATSGLVGEFEFTCVPAVPAGVTMAVVVLLLVPAVAMILRQPRSHEQRPAGGAGGNSLKMRDRGPVLPYGLFLKTVSYAAMTLFMFGYHVHEKAILVTLVPLTMLLSPSSDSAPGLGFSTNKERELWHAVYLQTSAGGVTALLPLLMNAEELALKGVLCFSFLIATHVLVAPASGPFYTRLNQASIAALLLLFVFNELVHPWLFWSAPLNTLRYPFLPQLLYSTCCAFLLLHAYCLLVLALFTGGKAISSSVAAPPPSNSDDATTARRRRNDRKRNENVRKPPLYRSLDQVSGEVVSGVSSAYGSLQGNNKSGGGRSRNGSVSSVSSRGSMTSNTSSNHTNQPGVE